MRLKFYFDDINLNYASLKQIKKTDTTWSQVSNASLKMSIQILNYEV